MMIKVLGFLDFVSAAIIAFFYSGLLPAVVVVGASIYLILKALIFFGDFISIIDGIVGIMTLLNIALHIGWIAYVAIMYLVAKGLISMMS